MVGRGASFYFYFFGGLVNKIVETHIQNDLFLDRTLSDVSRENFYAVQ